MKKALAVVSALALMLSLPAHAQQAGSSAAAKANQCVGCHDIEGYRSVFPEVYPIPRIAGQSAAYLEYALKAYRSGERTHPSMTGIAATLTDEEIKLLSEFYEKGGAE